MKPKFKVGDKVLLNKKVKTVRLVVDITHIFTIPEGKISWPNYDGYQYSVNGIEAWLDAGDLKHANSHIIKKRLGIK